MERETDQKEYSRTYAEINLGAIRHNILEERKRVGSHVKIMAVIKADAYGHGDVPVAEALDDLVDAYGVALAEEALHLRQQGIGKMILILGYTGSGWFEELISHDISQTVYSYPMAKELSEAAVRLGKTAKIHIKVDTGMSRIGFLPVRDNIDVIRAISELPGICLEGIFTHFARADEETSEAAREPFEKFIIFVRELEGRRSNMRRTVLPSYIFQKRILIWSVLVSRLMVCTLRSWCQRRSFTSARHFNGSRSSRLSRRFIPERVWHMAARLRPAERQSWLRSQSVTRMESGEICLEKGGF